MRDFVNGYNAEQERKSRKSSACTAPDAPERDDEMLHLQADGFWGGEKGFHDAEELRRQRQQSH